MKYKNILVPYDRSESAKRALQTALEFLAESDDAQVTVFFAAPIPEFESAQFMIAQQKAGVVGMNDEVISHMQREYLTYERNLLSEDLGGIASRDRVNVAMGQGKPSKAILDYASGHDIDLIIMGSRGLNAVVGMLGSVSYAVLRNAECPVLVEK